MVARGKAERWQKTKLQSNDIGSVFERSENMEHAVVLPQQSN